MTSAGRTMDPQLVAERLCAVAERALSMGLMSFPAFFEDWSRFVWSLRSNADDLAISSRRWRGFRGGSSTRSGDTRGMFIPYRNVLLASGVLEELRPADEPSRLCGHWRSNLPVPSGSDGPDTAWRIVGSRLAARPTDPFCADEVRRHISQCRPHMPKGGGLVAALHRSPRNEFRVMQLRAALAISARRINPDHTIVSMWPDCDDIDSPDIALFPRGSRRPSALIKCGLGNASDDSADAFLEFVAGPSADGRYDNARLVFLSVYDPDPELRARCETAGVEVVSVLLRRAPGDIPASSEARVAEDVFDQSNP